MGFLKFRWLFQNVLARKLYIFVFVLGLFEVSVDINLPIICERLSLIKVFCFAHVFNQLLHPRESFEALQTGKNFAGITVILDFIGGGFDYGSHGFMHGGSSFAHQWRKFSYTIIFKMLFWRRRWFWGRGGFGGGGRRMGWFRSGLRFLYPQIKGWFGD